MSMFKYSSTKNQVLVDNVWRKWEFDQHFFVRIHDVILYLDYIVFVYRRILLKEWRRRRRKKSSPCRSSLKKHTFLNLIILCFNSMTQVKVNLRSTTLPSHISLCPHLNRAKKKWLVVRQQVNRTSTCRTHCRMTSIMFKFRQTDRQTRRKKNERMNS